MMAYPLDVRWSFNHATCWARWAWRRAAHVYQGASLLLPTL